MASRIKFQSANHRVFGSHQKLQHGKCIVSKLFQSANHRVFGSHGGSPDHGRANGEILSFNQLIIAALVLTGSHKSLPKVGLIVSIR